MHRFKLVHNLPDGVSNSVIVRAVDQPEKVLKHFNAVSGDDLEAPVGCRVAVTLQPSKGYWAVCGEILPEHGLLELDAPRALPPHGVLSWWHDALGFAEAPGSQCSGYKLGFVDISVDLPELEFACDFEDLGTATEAAFANPAKGAHAAACIALATGLRRANGDLAMCGLAPDADAVFMSAADWTGDKLDPLATAEAIDRLVEEECDLIVLSAGDMRHRQPVLIEAIEDAAKNGVLVILAAGNTRGDLLHPARDLSEQAVAPFGHRSVPPEGSMLAEMVSDENAIFAAGPFFGSHETALNESVILAAPGIGLVIPWSHDDALVLTGSSFSAPVLAAALLNLLARKPDYLQKDGMDRTDYVMEILQISQLWGFESPGSRLRAPRLASN